MRCPALAVPLSAALAVATSAAAAPRPHVLFLLADDYGWANWGVHDAAPEVTTPFLNSLARSGVVLDRHCASPRRRRRQHIAPAPRP